MVKKNVVKDEFINLIETFNQHKLNYILNNKDVFTGLMRPSCFENGNDPFTVLEKYLKKSKNGCIDVKYKQNNGFGRYFAVGGMSMQTMPREIKHAIQDNYVDIDIVNCHPNILVHLAKGRNINTDHLERYINERDTLLEKLDLDKEAGKMVVLSLLNGGTEAFANLRIKPYWLSDLKEELETIHNSFAEDKEYKVHKAKRKEQGNDFNHKGSYMNILICDFENKILMAIYEYLGNPKDCVLSFDGLMVKDNETYNLTDVEQFIQKKFDITLSLKTKDFNQGFDMDNIDIPPFVEKEWFYNDISYFAQQEANETLNHDELEKWVEGAFVFVLHRGRHIMFTKNKEPEGHILYEPLEKPEYPEFKFKFEGKNTNLNKMYSNLKLINSQKLFDFIPYLTPLDESKISPDYFNTFSGYRWPYTKKSYPLNEDGFPEPPANLKVWINHLTNTLVKQGQGGKDLSYRVLQWFAHILQKPKNKPWSLVLHSLEGVGKGLFTDFIGQVLGQHHVGTFTSWEQITGNFNASMSNKLLYNLNEVTNFPTNQQSELLKAIIKDILLTINKKFTNQYDISNYARVLITTNNSKPVKIDFHDRRYCCIKSDNSVRGDKDYFKQLIDSKDDEAVQHEMFDFLSNYPLDGFDAEQPPMTAWKRELIGINLKSSFEFLKDVLEDNIDSINWEHNEIKIKATDLYAIYKAWGTTNGEHKSLSNRSFYAELKENGFEAKKIRLDNTPQNCFIIKKDVLQETIDRLLGITVST